MQVTETLSDGLRRAYSVVVPAADIESRRSKRLSELGRTINLPGFRPGKVPATVLRQRYGTAVQAEVVEESVNDATQRVLSDRGLRAATQPKVEVVSLDPAQDLEFKVELELFPEIAMPDFGAIEITRLRADPSEEQVAKALDDIAGRQRELVAEPESRPAATGDFLTIDFVGRVDGTAFSGGTGTDMDVEVGGSGFIPGFTEQLVGLSPGETRTIDVTFPEPYGAAELAGKAATFEITAKALKRAVVPAVDEELGKKLGFEGLDDLKAALRGRFQRELDQLARLRTKRSLLDVLAGQASFAVPAGMVETEFAKIWQQVEQARTQGQGDPDDSDKDDETLRAEYQGIAERRVRLGLLLSEIGRVNAITVASDEMVRAMRAEAARYPGQEQQVLEFFRKNPQAAETLRGPIFEEKVVDFVLELARVTDATVTPEELARDPDAGAAEGGAPEGGDATSAPGQTAGAES